MQPLLYAGLGFFVATFLSGLELLTASYPRTYFLVFRSGALWGYAIIYGVIAALLTFGADYLIASGKLKLNVSPVDRIPALAVFPLVTERIAVFVLPTGYT